MGERKDFSESLTERQREIVQRVAEDLHFFSHVDQGGDDLRPLSSKSRTRRCSANASIEVYNLSQEWMDEVQRTLEDVQPGNSHAFDASITESQRKYIHVMSRKLGLWTRSMGKGEERHLRAFNTSDFVARIRAELMVLENGASKSYESLTTTERDIVILLAEDLELVAQVVPGETATVVEVFNMPEFVSSVQSVLDDLADGQEHSFQCLSDRERRVVHCLAANNGLVDHSYDDGDEHCLSVGRYDALTKEVRCQLAALGSDVKEYDSSFTPLMRKVVHVAAEELGLQHATVSDDAGLRVVVAKQGVSLERNTDADGANGHVSAEVARHVQVDARVTRVFEAYATGQQGSTRIFMRYPDLREFLEDTQTSVVRRRQLKQLRHQLDNIYEDTLQLQIDMGCRTNKGLTRYYFKVFLESASKKLGWSLIHLLCTLLDT